LGVSGFDLAGAVRRFKIIEIQDVRQREAMRRRQMVRINPGYLTHRLDRVNAKMQFEKCARGIRVRMEGRDKRRERQTAIVALAGDPSQVRPADGAAEK